MENALLSLQSISKNYGGVKALVNVNLVINKGEIHSIVGENGAGKSTMMKIISGSILPSSGNFYLRDKKIIFRNAKESETQGIYIIYQEPTFFGDLTVLQNIFIGKELLNKLGFINWQKMKNQILPFFHRLKVDTGILNVKMRDLSIGLQQLILIIKGVFFEAELIILDEPTSILSHEESLTLFSIIKHLKDKGTAILYISHRIPEILKISDKISVMKDGHLLNTFERDSVSSDELINCMSGRAIKHISVTDNNSRNKNVILSVRNLSSEGAFSEISFQVCRGQIFGFYGLIGSGRTEIAHALIGERECTGEINFQGSPYFPVNAMESYRRGIIYLPEDRITQGIFLTDQIKNNMLAGLLNKLCKKKQGGV